MKTYLIMIFALCFIEGKSQCTFKEYEQYISDNCINCNQSEVNKFVFNKGKEADSTLNRTKKRFEDKLNENLYEEPVQKHKMKKSFSNTFKVLKDARQKVCSDYNHLTEGGYNDYYIFLFYWYYTDKMNEILTDMETTLFGD